MKKFILKTVVKASKKIGLIKINYKLKRYNFERDNNKIGLKEKKLEVNPIISSKVQIDKK